MYKVKMFSKLEEVEEYLNEVAKEGYKVASATHSFGIIGGNVVDRFLVVVEKAVQEIKVSKIEVGEIKDDKEEKKASSRSRKTKEDESK